MNNVNKTNVKFAVYLAAMVVLLVSFNFILELIQGLK
jgi:hypothetical protein